MKRGQQWETLKCFFVFLSMFCHQLSKHRTWLFFQPLSMFCHQLSKHRTWLFCHQLSMLSHQLSMFWHQLSKHSSWFQLSKHTLTLGFPISSSDHDVREDSFDISLDWLFCQLDILFHPRDFLAFTTASIDAENILHGISFYCMVLHSVVWCYAVLYGATTYYHI